MNKPLPAGFVRRQELGDAAGSCILWPRNYAPPQTPYNSGFQIINYLPCDFESSPTQKGVKDDCHNNSGADSSRKSTPGA